MPLFMGYFFQPLTFALDIKKERSLQQLAVV
jgi:hypothetical protein